MKKSRRNFFFLLAILCLAGCQPVKPFQRVYLNDHEMQGGWRGAGLFEEKVQLYREGASGGGGSKTSGGCGCN